MSNNYSILESKINKKLFFKPFHIKSGTIVLINILIQNYILFINTKKNISLCNNTLKGNNTL